MFRNEQGSQSLGPTGHKRVKGIFKNASTCRAVPERVCQAETAFPPGASVTGAPGEVMHSSSPLVALRPAAFSWSLFRGSSRLSSLREVAIVLCRRDCSQHIPSQGTTHDDREQLCPATGPGGCGRIWCEFLTVRATPSRATCCWPRPLLADAAASTVRLELAPTGGISSCRQATPIEQPGRSFPPLLSSLVCPVRQPLRGAYNTTGLGGGEGSARKQPERRPRGQGRMGRHDAALFHSGLAPKR